MAELGTVELQFAPDGTLVYTIHHDGGEQIIQLTWRTEGGTIITNQPSRPKEHTSSYSLLPDRRLIIHFDGVPYSFIKFR